jgi:hypothetical protein
VLYPPRIRDSGAGHGVGYGFYIVESFYLGRGCTSSAGISFVGDLGETRRVHGRVVFTAASVITSSARISFVGDLGKAVLLSGVWLVVLLLGDWSSDFAVESDYCICLSGSGRYRAWIHPWAVRRVVLVSGLLRIRAALDR